MKKLLLLLLFIPLVSFGQVKNGLYSSYYESGEIESTVNYVNDLRQGEQKAYFKTGELSSTVNFVDDLRQGETKYYNIQGELLSTVNFVDGVEQSPDGFVDGDEQSPDGLRQGEEKYYYESGELRRTENFLDGLRQGESKWYYKSGELEVTENYVDHLRQGEWKWYYESGELKRTVNYVDGIEQQLVSFGQIDSSESEVIKEPVVRNEFSIKITDLSIIDSRKPESEYSIIVYKNNEVFQNIKTPANMLYHPFEKRFFRTADINFDGYDDFLFIDSMAMVNYSYIVYLYNPFSEKFEINEDYGSISSPEFDIDHQIIKSINRGNAAYYETEIFIVLNDKLTRISKTIDDYGSNAYKYIIYDGKKEVDVNEALRRVELYIGFFKTKKFNIIIDLLDNGKYRYASWSVSRNLRNNPDLILKNGVKEESENEISYKFKKGEFSYTCIFNKLTNNGHLKVYHNQKELVDQKASVFIIPNEVKQYISNKHKVTISL